MFAKKGKRLVVDSEEDGDGGAGGGGDGGAWSVDESELSAWDSDVASVSALGGAVKDWRAVSGFSAPAEAALQLALWATMVSAVCLRGERGLATGRMKLGGWEQIDIQKHAHTRFTLNRRPKCNRRSPRTRAGRRSAR